MIILVLLAVFFVMGLPNSSAYALELPAEPSMVVSSDATWKSSRTSTAGWEKLDYDDSLWKNAASPSIGTCTLGREKPSFTTPMWYPNAAERQTVHFRKTFMLPDNPEAAYMKVAFDDDGEVYINGIKVVTDASGKTESIAIEKEATQYLHKGENVVAMKVYDTRGGCQWTQVLFDLYVIDRPFVNIPHFKQTDPQWAQEQYAGGSADKLRCGSTLAGCGCLTSSLAMALHGYKITKLASGVEISPKTLNEYLKQGQTCSAIGCVSKGYVYGNVRWAAVHELSQQAHTQFGSQKIQFVGFNDFGPTAVTAKLEDEHSVIAKSPLESHWFVIFGAQDDTFDVADPLFPDTLLSGRYQNTAARTADFKKVNSDFSQIEIYVKAPYHVTITDNAGRSVGYATGAGTITPIPRSSYMFESAPEVEPGTDSAIEAEGVNVLIVSQPEQGQYVVETNAPETAIYLSEQSGADTHQTLSGSRLLIHYDPVSVDTSSVSETVLLACRADAFSSEVTLKGRNLLGTPVVLQGKIEVFPTAQTPAVE